MVKVKGILAWQWNHRNRRMRGGTLSALKGQAFRQTSKTMGTRDANPIQGSCDRSRGPFSEQASK